MGALVSLVFVIFSMFFLFLFFSHFCVFGGVQISNPHDGARWVADLLKTFGFLFFWFSRRFCYGFFRAALVSLLFLIFSMFFSPCSTLAIPFSCVWRSARLLYLHSPDPWNAGPPFEHRAPYVLRLTPRKKGVRYTLAPSSTVRLLDCQTVSLSDCQTVRLLVAKCMSWAPARQWGSWAPSRPYISFCFWKTNMSTSQSNRLTV